MPLIGTRAAASAQGFSFTQIASAVDRLFEYVSLLLTGNGTNGAQNNTFLDSSSNNFTVTRNGNTTQGSFSPFGDTWSNYFDGAGDSLTVADNAALEFGSGDFTIECYFNSLSVSGTSVIFCKHDLATGAWIIYRNGSTIQFYLSSTGSSWDICNGVTVGTITANTWNHVAISRSGSSIRSFLNGVLGNTTTSSSSVYDGTQAVAFGANVTALGDYFTGYISNARIVKGTAVYTANFIPPTSPLTAITNTSLLTCQSNRFIDNSTNNFAITVNGNTSVQKFSPFLPNPNTWSNYFDGAGDKLTTPSSSNLDLSSGDFTAEAWVYTTTVAAGDAFILFRGSSGNITEGLDLQFSIYRSGSSLIVRPYQNTTDYSINIGTILANNWYHVALTRSGNTFRGFLNGVVSGTTQTITGALNNNSGWPGAIIGLGTIGGVDAAFAGYISNIRILKGTAQYTANFTPPTAPLTAITNTQLLTCQNSTIRDNSPNRFPITVNGNVAPNTLSPFLGFSGYFDGAGDGLRVPYNLNLYPGATGDYTLECWIYITGNETGFQFIVGANNTTTSDWQIVNEAGSLYGTLGGVFDILGTAVPNRWIHLAVVRSGSRVYGYYNGTRSFDIAAGTQANNNLPFDIGMRNSVDRPFLGYIAGVRIVKGTAVYTAATITVPPVPVLPITNTSLLLNFANAGIQDVAMINDIETVGNAQVSTTQSKFGGASLSFDGTGDYLVLNPSSPDVFAFGSGDWTIEFWVRLNATQTAIIYDGRPVSGIGATPTIYVSSNQLFYFTNNANRITGSTLASNTWYHIAVSKSSGSTRMFVDGVQVGSTYADAVSYTNSASRPIIGASGETLNTNSVNGYLDELRITKGIARYVSNFNPPPAPFKTY